MEVRTFKVRRKYHELFEPKNIPETSPEWDLIYVKYQDLDGYVHYEFCGDGTQQDYTMTEVELLRDYKRMVG